MNITNELNNYFKIDKNKVVDSNPNVNYSLKNIHYDDNCKGMKILTIEKQFGVKRPAELLKIRYQGDKDSYQKEYQAEFESGETFWLTKNEFDFVK